MSSFLSKSIPTLQQSKAYDSLQLKYSRSTDYFTECYRLIKLGRAPVFNKIHNLLWIKSLQFGDKLDIYEQRGTPKWYIGTICGIKSYESANCFFKLHIHYDGWDPTYDEEIPIQYQTIGEISNKLAPLHTHTIYHHPINYDICNTKLSYKTCVLCNNMFCDRCVSAYNINDQIQCRTCTISNEENILSNAIKDAIYHHDTHNDLKEVIHTITHYAIGYVIDCSNVQLCNNEISIENQFDFIRDIGSYSFYPIRDKLIDSYNAHKVIKLYGKHYRFSCGVCEMYQCERFARPMVCYNMDTEYRICMNHPMCCVCKEYFTYLKDDNQCKLCDGIVCDECKCGFQCKSCILSLEYTNMKAIIVLSIQTNGYKSCADVIDLIMEYSCGYVINCNVGCCDNEIAFDDIIELNKYPLHYVIDDKYVDYRNIGKFIRLCGKYMRFSCGLCGDIDKCKCGSCDNVDAEEEMCFNHPTCYLCKGRNFGINTVAVECDACKRKFCDGCGLKSSLLPMSSFLCSGCLFGPNRTLMKLNQLKQILAPDQFVCMPTIQSLNNNALSVSPMVAMVPVGLYPMPVYNPQYFSNQQ